MVEALSIQPTMLESRQKAIKSIETQLKDFAGEYFKSIKEDIPPRDFHDEVTKIKNRKYELVVIGNTNVGKSTFLTQITKMKDFFNVSNNRETSCIWRFINDPFQEQPFTVREIYLKQDTQNMELEYTPLQLIESADNVKKYIKEQRKPAA